jgi:hypothetical protein
VIVRNCNPPGNYRHELLEISDFWVNKYSLGGRWPRDSCGRSSLYSDPLLGLLSHLMQALKHKHIEYCFAVAAIESFDKAVLHRPSGLDELEQHVMVFGPIGQGHRHHLWVIV